MTQSAELYPSIQPYSVDELQVSERHKVVFEQVGNPNGRPALFLHGGPGVGIVPNYRRFFDPQHYRVILVDQRGAGRSTPHAEVAENTTWDIVEDLEKIRIELNIEDWVVMGGSWGSLLALCYAIKHPTSVAGMIIRGIFLGRKKEIDWLYKPGGASVIYPDEWAHYVAPVGDAADIPKAYSELLNHQDQSIALSAARAWSRWEGAIMTLFPSPSALGSMTNDHAALSIARIESHFSNHGFFLEPDNFVLDNARVIADIPCRIVQGRYDIICPMISAWELHQALPSSALTIVPDGAHSPLDGGMTTELVQAAEEFKSL